MDTKKITEIIIAELGLPEYHQHRATLQVWFELMLTWREYGNPKVISEDDICQAAVRCVDKLVGDAIITDSTEELKAQDTIIQVLDWTRLDYIG